VLLEWVLVAEACMARNLQLVVLGWIMVVSCHLWMTTWTKMLVVDLGGV